MNQVVPNTTCECLNATMNDCQNTAIKHRLARSAGHLKFVLRMLDEEQNLIRIIFQLRAVQESIKGCSILILQNHLTTCKNTKSLEAMLQDVLFLLHDVDQDSLPSEDTER